MSKVGKKTIVLPEGLKVEVKVTRVFLSGVKGEASLPIPKGLEVLLSPGKIGVISKKGERKASALQGTFRALIANMVRGVSAGWSKKLELVGSGFRAETDGRKLSLLVGFSHPVVFEAPEGINFNVEKNIVEVSGVDRYLVGEVSAKIRSCRPPEPYKGKGIKYVDEVIRKKAGKAAKGEIPQA